MSSIQYRKRFQRKSKKFLFSFLLAGAMILAPTSLAQADESTHTQHSDSQDIIGWQQNSTITWSIDTSGLDKPHRYRKAARAAFAQWEATGHRFVHVPTGGEISVIVSPKMDPRWGGYGLWSKITPCGENSWRIREGIIVVNLKKENTYKRIWQIISHEIGHVLGVPHLDDPTTLMHASTILSGGYVTATDIQYEQSRQRNCEHIEETTES